MHKIKLLMLIIVSGFLTACEAEKKRRKKLFRKPSSMR